MTSYWARWRLQSPASPTVYSGADQRKHQSSASLAFVRGIQIQIQKKFIAAQENTYHKHYRHRFIFGTLYWVYRSSTNACIHVTTSSVPIKIIDMQQGTVCQEQQKGLRNPDGLMGPESDALCIRVKWHNRSTTYRQHNDGLVQDRSNGDTAVPHQAIDIFV